MITARNSQRAIPMIFILVSFCSLAAGKIIYVDPDAFWIYDGTSWTNAYPCLQNALADAVPGDEIRVAKGAYRPDQYAMMRRGHLQIVSSGDWTDTFQMIDGVTIKGGYAGFGEPNPDARNVEQYESILSGDLNADDGAEYINIWDNSYHVVTASGTNWTAVLDGFTITGGNADGSFPYDNGAGIYNSEGSPTIINCRLSGNSTTGNGGGMFNDNSDPVILNCKLTGNSAGSRGGGMYNNKSNPQLTKCTFSENSAGSGGGGMYNEDSDPKLADCVFTDNSTTGSGGGMYNNSSDSELVNCSFSTNSASRSGGGMYNRYTSQPTLANCIFSGNSALRGGAMENLNTTRPELVNCTLSANIATYSAGGISSIQESLTSLVNCILCDNSDQSGTGTFSSQIDGQAVVTYSCVLNSLSEDVWPGEGNINADPCFAVPGHWDSNGTPDNPDDDFRIDGDYHLKSQMGRWDPASNGWAIDQTSSLCIDAGDPSVSVGLERFPNGRRINMGAYGGTPEASLSPLWLVPSPGKAFNPIPADGAIVGISLTLTWAAGSGAVTHDVYLGTDRDAVANATRDNLLTVLVAQEQSETHFDPGYLNYDQIYFWRIDEVSAPPESTITKGDIWSFITVSSPPKGRTCFTGQTCVCIGDSAIPISKAVVGQRIKCITGSDKVEAVEEHHGTFELFDVLLESGNCITVAENHFFMTKTGQWISLKNLKAVNDIPFRGVELKTSKGSIGIKSITRQPKQFVGTVYNLKIESSDTYLVGGDEIIVRDY